MTEQAQETSFAGAADTTGLDEIFSCHDKAGQEGLTLEEASARLNLSERTIQRRLKRGLIKGFKVPGPRGPEWRICMESWQDTPPSLTVSSDDMPPTLAGSSDDTTLVELLSSDDMPPAQAVSRDDTSALETSSLNTPNKKSMPQRELPAEDYKSQLIKELQAKLEGASYRIGYLEAQTHNYQEQIKLLTDSQHKGSWWQRFCSWFVG